MCSKLRHFVEENKQRVSIGPVLDAVKLCNRCSIGVLEKDLPLPSVVLSEWEENTAMVCLASHLDAGLNGQFVVANE